MISQAELAKALGVDPALVTRYAKRGMPVYSIDAARTWRAANVRPRAKSNATPQGDGSGANGSVYWDAKTRREVAEANKAELEAKKMAGSLGDVEGMARAAFAVGRLHRDVLLALPPRCAAELAALTTPQEVEQLLTERLRAVLDDMAKAAAAGLPGVAVSA